MPWVSIVAGSRVVSYRGVEIRHDRSVEGFIRSFIHWWMGGQKGGHRYVMPGDATERERVRTLKKSRHAFLLNTVWPLLSFI